MALGYKCSHTFRFTVGALNAIFFYAFLLLPFLAIKPMRRLHSWCRTLGFILLTPLLLLSSLLILGAIVFGLSVRVPLQTLQQGNSTIELVRYVQRGSLVFPAVYLEQRRHFIPGLYLVRSIDFVGLAPDAPTLSLDGPYRVRVHLEGNDVKTDKVYVLKPWLYF